MHLQVSPHYPELFLAAYGAKDAPFVGHGLDRAQDPSADEAAGLVCVWSLEGPEQPARPQFTLTAPSAVLSASFLPSHPSLIVGTCYNGQLGLWDLRSGVSSWVRSSSLWDDSRLGHKQPVYHLLLLSGNRNGAFKLAGQAAAAVAAAAAAGTGDDAITASADGTICRWDLSQQLGQGQGQGQGQGKSLSPAASWRLQRDGLSRTVRRGEGDRGVGAASGSTENLAALNGMTGRSSGGGGGEDDGAGSSSMVITAAALGGGSGMVVGCCEGTLYNLQLPASALAADSDAASGDPRGNRLRAAHEHAGMVSSMHAHPLQAGTGSTQGQEGQEGQEGQLYRHLVLTASCLDWTFRLWRLPPLQLPLPLPQDLPARPVCEFRTTDYGCICDIQWHPANPAVFACVTTSGCLHVWNLAVSVLAPVGVQLVGGAGAGAGAGVPAEATAPGGSGSGSSSSTGGGADASASASASADAPVLHKLVWARDGRAVLVAACSGEVFRIAVHEGHVAVREGDAARVGAALGLEEAEEA